MKKYYITEQDGVQKGPYSEEMLFKMLNSGEITHNTLLWCEGMTNWEQYGHIYTAEANQVAEVNSTGKCFSAKKLSGKKKTVGIIVGAVLSVIGVSIFLFSSESELSSGTQSVPKKQATGAGTYKKMSRKAARTELKTRGLTLDDDKSILSAARENPELLNIFIQAGMNVNKKRSVYENRGYLPHSYALNMAALGYNPECMRLLLKAGAKVDKKERGGKSTLHCLLDFETPEKMQETTACAKLLIDAGIDIHATDDSQRQAIHEAAELINGTGALALLIQAGANINAVDDCGELPIHKAARCENSENLKLLMAAGADINVGSSDDNDATPLVCAVRVPENVQMLLAAGAKGKDRALYYAIRLIELEYDDEHGILNAPLYNKLERSIALLRAAGAKESKDSL